MIKLPEEFKNRMKEYLGDEYEAFMLSYDETEVKGLRFNATGDSMSPAVCFGEVCKFEKVPWEGCGVYYRLNNELANASGDDVLGDGDAVSDVAGFGFGKHPYHEAGVYYMQEPSAMSPVYYLDVQPGDRILDLCASPGGKSTQIGSKMKGDGAFVANEINSSRAKILSENIERMGIRNALVINEDPRDISDRFSGFFDKVLVDAPCSGEGMFRRLEAAVDEWSGANVDMCSHRQSWILDEAAKMLKDGGVLVYSTCTFSKEENENNIASFLARHSEFSPVKMDLFDGMTHGFDDIGVRLYPHKIKGEGHYVCKLVKDGGENNYKQIKYESGITKKDKQKIEGMYEFLEDNIAGSIKGDIMSKNLTLFGDNIYMLPDECPSLKGLKVLRPGLHIGTIKKNRFEPAHALAMTIGKCDVRQSINLICDGKNNNVIYKYLNGETFDLNELNLDDFELSGWALICVDDYSLGWGKVTNGIVKNHYPKGLRKRYM